MKLYKKVLLALLIVFIVIQFIQPAHNSSMQLLPADIIRTINVPDNIGHIFKNACNDCHTNQTRYPWYVYIQPMGWIMANHVNDGKANLNLSEFGNYSKRKQANKLRAIATSIKESSMPIKSYTLMHTNAKLSTKDKDLIIDWAIKTRDSLLAKD